MPVDHILAPQNKKQVSGTAIVLIILVAVLVIAGVVALIVSLTEEEFDPGDFVGYWRATEKVDDGGVWYVHIQRDGDAYTLLDSLRFPDAPLPAVLDGELLVVEHTPGAHDEYRLGNDAQVLKVTYWVDSDATYTPAPRSFKRWDDAEEDLAALAKRQAEKAKESAVIEAMHTLQIGIQSWAVDHDDRWPPRSAVRTDGAMASYVDRWPDNPYTGEPVAPGDAPGDYTYTREGGAYRLTGHFEGGGGFTVP